jgi:NTE family protein
MLRSVTALLLAASLTASAADTAPKCIGLVLGGGGARGAAHIGVLKVLERERIPVCRIAGTSMGSIVGGLYASGYTPGEIEAILSTVNWKDVLDDDPPRADFPMRRKNDTLRYLLNYRFGLRDGAIQLPRGVIQGQKLLLLLRRLTLHTWRTPDFDTLPIPFRAVATDIVSGEQVLFKEGDLALAIRSSMSVPAAFAPIRVDGRLLVDGGIVNNVPVDIARSMGADRLIVVDVGAPLANDESLNSPFAITMQMLDVLMKQRTQDVLATMAPDDIKILPQLGNMSSAAFDDAAMAIPLGEAAAEAQLEKLRAWSVSEDQYQQYQAAHRRVEFDPPLLGFLDVVKNRSKTAGYVERALDGFVGEPLDVATLERAIGRAYGLNNYERITWNPVVRGDEVGVDVTPVDKGWGPNFVTFGLQISDDFQGDNDYQLGIEYTMTGLNRYGGEWRSRGEIGRITGLRTEFFQPAGSSGQYFVFPYVEYRAYDQPLRVGNAVPSEYRVRRGAVGFDAGYEIDNATRVYAGLVRGYDKATVSVGESGMIPGLSTVSNLGRFGLIRDTLDDANFPRSGGRGELLLLADVPGLGSAGDGQIVDVSWDHAISTGRSRFLLGARLHASWGRPNAFNALAPLGGFTNLSGYAERELLGEQSALFRSIYYRRLGDEGRLFSVPAFVGASLEAGNVYRERSQLVSLENLIFAGSVFVGIDSPFGPIFLGYGRADTGASSVYLNFGTLLRPRL